MGIQGCITIYVVHLSGILTVSRMIEDVSLKVPYISTIPVSYFSPIPENPDNLYQSTSGRSSIPSTLMSITVWSYSRENLSILFFFFWQIDQTWFPLKIFPRGVLYPFSFNQSETFWKSIPSSSWSLQIKENSPFWYSE